MKNKKIIFTIFIIMVILAVVFHHLYFTVKGTIISDSLTRNEISTIRIIKTYNTSEKTDIVKETVLNEKQKDMLILLLKDTKFKKIISKTVLFKDKDRYIVTGENSNGRVLFRLESYGGEFILVDSMNGVSKPNHWKLRIKNDEWKTTLEKIILLSN